MPERTARASNAAGAAVSAVDIDLDADLFRRARGGAGSAAGRLGGALATSGGIGATALTGGLGLTAIGAGAAIAAGVTIAYGIIDAVQESGRVDRAIRSAGSTLSTADTEEEFKASITEADEAIRQARQRESFDPTSKDALTLTLGLGLAYANIFGGADKDVSEAEQLKKR